MESNEVTSMTSEIPKRDRGQIEAIKGLAESLRKLLSFDPKKEKELIDQIAYRIVLDLEKYAKKYVEGLYDNGKQ